MMRAAIVLAVFSALLGVSASGRTEENLPPPGGHPARVPVNSQKSLVDAVGDGFRDEAWEYPTGLLPRDFPGLIFVSGPGDQGLAPKAAWRTPVVLKDEASGMVASLNVYRRRDAKDTAGSGATTPFAPLLEPDCRYNRAEFHGLRAATASEGDREVFAFRDGALLFKIEMTGGKVKMRRRAAITVAEAIWMFRHPQ